MRRVAASKAAGAGPRLAGPGQKCAHLQHRPLRCARAAAPLPPPPAATPCLSAWRSPGGPALRGQEAPGTHAAMHVRTGPTCPSTHAAGSHSVRSPPPPPPPLRQQPASRTPPRPKAVPRGGQAPPGALFSPLCDGRWDPTRPRSALRSRPARQAAQWPGGAPCMRPPRQAPEADQGLLKPPARPSAWPPHRRRALPSPRGLSLALPPRRRCGLRLAPPCWPYVPQERGRLRLRVPSALPPLCLFSNFLAQGG